MTINYAPAPDESRRRMAASLLGVSPYGTEKTASRYGRMAESLMAAGASTDPVGHPLQAVARGFQGMMGGYYGALADQESQLAEQRETQAALDKERRTSDAALAKEDRDQQNAIALAKEKAAIEQSAPAYLAGLAKTQAETADLTAKERYRQTLMGMLTGDEEDPAAADALNVGGPPKYHSGSPIQESLPPAAGMPAAPPPPAQPGPPPATLPGGMPPPPPGVQPQSFDGAMPGVQMENASNVSPAPDESRRRMAASLLGVSPYGTEKTASRYGRMAESLMAAGAPPQAMPASADERRMRLAQTLAGAGDGAMPGVQFVADAAPATPAPQNAARAPDMVDTPFGRMTRERARRVGGAMMMDPQTATAGKALFDQAMSQTAPGLSQPTIKALQEKQLNTTEGFARLRNIEQTFKPEYQTIETRIGNKWSELMDSFSATRQSLTDEQKTQLSEFSAFRADALNNLNQYIKEITGAAMTNAEAERIMQAMPNPGDKVWNGDSPTVFKAKLDAALRNSKMALARYNYLSKNGFSGSVDDMARALPLEQMGGMIQNRTNELVKDTLSQNPGLTPQDVAPLVRQRLRAEFGIDA